MAIKKNPSQKFRFMSTTASLSILNFFILSISIFSTSLHAQTFICIGDDQVPEYTQRKTGKNCKSVNLPGISYGSGASNSNYVYKSNKNNSNNSNNNAYNSAPAYPKKTSNSNLNATLPSPLNNPNAGLNTAPPLPNANPSGGYAPPSSLPKNLGGQRKTILQQELTEKQSKLSTLEKEFNQGQPSRNEKNYQIYLDRTKKLGEEINRTKGDIDALLREMNM